MQITDLKSGERYEQDKAQRLARLAATGSNDRFALSGRPRLNAQQEPQAASSALLAPELPTNPPFGLCSPEKTKDGKSLTNGVNGDHKPPAEPKFELQPLEKNRGPEVTSDNPDFHLLTKNEQDVVRGLKIQPKAYIVMKDGVMREALKAGGSLKKKTVRDICRIDTSKASRLFDFFVWSGWISKG